MTGAFEADKKRDACHVRLRAMMVLVVNGVASGLSAREKQWMEKYNGQHLPYKNATLPPTKKLRICNGSSLPSL